MKHTATPWKVGDLGGKYYGTTIVGQGTKPIATLWDHSYPNLDGKPSERQEASWGACNEEEHAELVCDSHYEDATDYANAAFIVQACNAMPKIIELLQRIQAFAHGDADKGQCLTRLDACQKAATDALAMAKGEPA